ncbi:MAG: signal peptidase II [Myxococcaceae bacterium]|nr:signal peptidase II [Myxococcaceae bacterium]
MQKKYVVLIAVALGVVALDQWVKFEVLSELTTALDGKGGGDGIGVFLHDAPELRFDGFHYQSKRAITVSENFFRLRYAENPGAAFGLFRGLPENLRGPLFHLVTLGAVVLISYYFTKLTGAKVERFAYYGLPLVLGGAVGNWIDRLARGFVIDFLEAHWFDKAAWPSFNVADMAICVGVGLLLIDSFVRKEKKDAKPVPAQSAA